MSSYLINNYKGKYQLQAEIDQSTGDFCRDENGDLDNFTDIWINCDGKGKIFHYGGKILQYYCPTIGRGRNVLKDIYSGIIGSYEQYVTKNTYTDKEGNERESNIVNYDLIYADLKDNGIIFDIEETDEEILFKFKSTNIEKLEEYIKPKTYCADRSPFSIKNIRKQQRKNGEEKYAIPLQELELYKQISSQISKDNISVYNKINNGFITTIVKKMRTNSDDLKQKIKLSGLKPKEYFHSLGDETWKNYLDYMNKYIKENLEEE